MAKVEGEFDFHSKVRIKNLSLYLEISNKIILMKYGGYGRNFFTVENTF